MKALVISGGGSKGAYAGGIAQYLINDKGNKYDLFVGTSVGSIIVSQLAINNVSKLKSIFTHLTNDDIFSISPFKIKNKNGEYSVSINHFNTIRAFLKGCNTFGESKALRKLIQRVFTKEDFLELKNKAKVVFTVSNLTLQKTEYIEVNDGTYEDCCDWMWASANVVPFMSLLNKNNCQYADGGFGSHVSVIHAIEQGATDIDVISLKSPMPTLQSKPLINPFQATFGVLKFMSGQIGLKDMLIGKLKGKQSQIDIKLYLSPENLTNNPLYFNPELMNKWWEMGYEFASNNAPICHCFLPNGEVIDMNM